MTDSATLDVISKQCRLCKQVLSLTEFSPRKEMRDGLREAGVG